MNPKPGRSQQFCLDLRDVLSALTLEGHADALEEIAKLLPLLDPETTIPIVAGSSVLLSAASRLPPLSPVWDAINPVFANWDDVVARELAARPAEVFGIRAPLYWPMRDDPRCQMGYLLYTRTSLGPPMLIRAAGPGNRVLLEISGGIKEVPKDCPLDTIVEACDELGSIQHAMPLRDVCGNESVVLFQETGVTYVRRHDLGRWTRLWSRDDQPVKYVKAAARLKINGSPSRYPTIENFEPV